MAHNALCQLGVREARQQHDKSRGGASERGYDGLWQRFRMWFLRRHPLCADCLTEWATDVHHVMALRDGGERLDEGNCQALCKTCHSRKTAQGL